VIANASITRPPGGREKMIVLQPAPHLVLGQLRAVQVVGEQVVERDAGGLAGVDPEHEARQLAHPVKKTTPR
jgi:hypothetical protein